MKFGPIEQLPDGKKRCRKCKQILNTDSFYKRSQGKHYSYCKICTKVLNSEYRQSHSDAIQVQRKEHYQTNKTELQQKERYQAADKEALREYIRKYRSKHREKLVAYSKEYWRANKSRLSSEANNKYHSDLAHSLWVGAKVRAKRLSIPFTLSEQDVVIPELCPTLGIPLVSGKGRTTQNSPTIDRLFPDLGYVPGNISVISRFANTIKQDATDPEDLLRIARFYEGLPITVSPKHPDARKILKTCLEHARRRAKRKGLECTIAKDLHVPTTCPCCGVPLRINPGRHGKDSPTIDRIDNNLGYVAGNVIFVCYRCNAIKSSATIEQLKTVAKWMQMRIEQAKG
jgi:hypothetical protein